MNGHTLTDRKFMHELESGREALLADPGRGLLRILRRRLQSITRNVYILSWIPEQGEDLYDVLVDGAIVAHVEISRSNPDVAVVFESWSVNEYRTRRMFTKPDRRKLDLALQLAQSLNRDR